MKPAHRYMGAERPPQPPWPGWGAVGLELGRVLLPPAPGRPLPAACLLRAAGPGPGLRCTAIAAFVRPARRLPPRPPPSRSPGAQLRASAGSRDRAPSSARPRGLRAWEQERFSKAHALLSQPPPPAPFPHKLEKAGGVP